MTILSKTPIREILRNCPTCSEIGFSQSFVIADSKISSSIIDLDRMDCSPLLVDDFNDNDETLRLKIGKSELPVKAGVSVIVGRAAAGKTTFLKNVLLPKNSESITFISYGEPDAGSLMSQETLFNKMLDAPTEVIICDSIRRWFFASGGATGKGGVNMSLFMTLTAWDLLAKATQKHIIFVLNPLSIDNEAIDLYVEASKGAVSMVMYATEPGSLQITGRFMQSRAVRDVKYELPDANAHLVRTQNRKQDKNEDHDQNTQIPDFVQSSIGDLYLLRHRKDKTN